MKLQLLENMTPNDIIKTLLGKNYYATSEINLSYVKGELVFLPATRRKKIIFIQWNKRKPKKAAYFYSMKIDNIDWQYNLQCLYLSRNLLS